MFVLPIGSSLMMKCHHCSIYLSTTQDLAKVSAPFASLPATRQFFTESHIASIASENLPTSIRGSRWHCKGAKTRGDQSTCCILISVAGRQGVALRALSRPVVGSRCSAPTRAGYIMRSMICAAVSLPIHSFVSYGFFFVFGRGCRILCSKFQGRREP
jgi:hypothetical protein